MVGDSSIERLELELEEAFKKTAEAIIKLVRNGRDRSSVLSGINQACKATDSQIIKNIQDLYEDLPKDQRAKIHRLLEESGSFRLPLGSL